MTYDDSEQRAQAARKEPAPTPGTAPPAAAARPGGAPLNNENALKSGTDAWLKTGRVPRCYSALRRHLRVKAAGLVAEVERVKGRAATAFELCVISTVIRHAGRIALLERWLAKEHRELSLSDRLGLLKEIGAASTSHDKALQGLGLDREDGLDDYDRYLRGDA